ncbi:MAG: carotenoid 1,2-hydratase [Nitrospirae bacterium]|nr:carotenoid 1,2-hydratase [Nitrospirota bacterium]
MNKTAALFVLISLLAPGTGSAKEFKPALPGYSYHFPADHGSHDDYQVEWWYFTGHLTDKKGSQTGFELTFFRTGVQNDSIRGNPSKWRVENIYSAHFAISDEMEKTFWFQEKISREALGKAGAEKSHFHAWIDHWYGNEKQGVFYLGAEEGAGENKKKIELKLIPEKPLVIHGQMGVSPKDEKEINRSHYYSFTRLKTSGTLVLNGKELEVEGISWMDHEFGSSPLLPSQTGWDWFSIQLDNRTELMFYQIRNKDGSAPFSFGTLIDENGKTETLHSKDFSIRAKGRWRSPGGGSYPMGWELTLPREHLTLLLTPAIENQELNVFGGKMRYWEGSVSVSEKSSTLSGAGYVELTGYQTGFDSLFSQKGQ